MRPYGELSTLPPAPALTVKVTGPLIVVVVDEAGLNVAVIVSFDATRV